MATGWTLGFVMTNAFLEKTSKFALNALKPPVNPLKFATKIYWK